MMTAVLPPQKLENQMEEAFTKTQRKFKELNRFLIECELLFGQHTTGASPSSNFQEGTSFSTQAWRERICRLFDAIATLIR